MTQEVSFSAKGREEVRERFLKGIGGVVGAWGTAPSQNGRRRQIGGKQENLK